ncbi:MAG: fumarylacetoacetate hydrolase family protein [Acidobacteriota bacterium]|nr:fumarylacetoacetate hydrolase family protein [Acidobacteriota bacterium]
MKLCHFEYKNEKHWGVVKNDAVFPLDNLENIYQQSRAVKSKKLTKIKNVKFLPPVSPSKIVCVGRNYAAHAAEFGNEVPQEPLLFLKAPSAIITEGEAIVLPKQSNQVEHEGELAVVISSTCKNLSESDDPFEFVFGYTCLNDITARDLQRRDGQFTRAKSFDTFCPIGAFIETELDVANIRVTTKVNGVIKQTGRTSQMVHPVPFLIRYISNQMTLNAGDIIATGTPSGVSKLSDGDMVEVEIKGIGVLRNPVKV